jgi:hypothetical protein
MSITLFGNWRLEVLEAIHTLPNRYVISGASAGNGTFDPVVGTVLLVDGVSWQLEAQYRPLGEDWQPSIMNQEVVLGQDYVNMHLILGSEDPLPPEDFKDIRFSAIFLGGHMIDVPYRPYAVRTSDLGQMPDGIFEAKLGIYYMGVRVRNIWGLPFKYDHVVDITPESRAALLQGGIQVLDSWTTEELEMLGQQVTNHGVALGPNIPGQSKTIFFKVDVTHALSRKHEVEFICRNTAGMADPNHQGRKAKQVIFVSRTIYDAQKNEFIIDVPEGTARIHINQVTLDENGLKKSVKKAKKNLPRTKSADLKKLKEILSSLLEGRNVDPCEIQRVLSCYCSSSGKDYSPYYYDPYYLIFTQFSARVIPRLPYSGQSGPIPYEDPLWKVLFAILAALLALLGGAEEAAQSAYEDEDLIIGTLHDYERHQLDAALCRIDTSRELKFRTVLDAQSNEDNQVTVEPDNLNGTVSISGDILSREEIEDLMYDAEETGNLDLIRVFKSGERTGLTFAQIEDWPDGWVRQDDQTRFDDEDRPTLRFGVVEGSDPANLVSNKGDSGSVWVHFDSKRPIALNHSGNPDANTATGSLLEFIVDRFGITF